METQNSVSRDGTTKDRGWRQTRRTERRLGLVAAPTIDEYVTEPVSRTAYRVQRLHRARCKFTRRLASSFERRMPVPVDSNWPCSLPGRERMSYLRGLSSYDESRDTTPRSVDRWTSVRRNRLRYSAATYSLRMRGICWSDEGSIRISSIARNESTTERNAMT